MNRLLIGFVFLFASTVTVDVRANSFLDGVNYHTPEKWEMGFLVGTFLPRNVSFGVQEKLGFSGVYISHPTRLADIEYIYMGGRGDDVDYINAAIRMRIDFQYYGIFNGYMTVGADLHRYKRAPTEVYEFDYINKTGISAGFGFTGQVAGPWHFRSDVKYNIGPGKSLFVGVGLSYNFNSDSGDAITP